MAPGRSDPEPREDTGDTGAEADSAYRGFLFADLRGYTAFVERHGAASAADLLDAYRQLVREEVAKHAGAEVRTEGDSFYVVFPSARRAVTCALGIITAAMRDAEDHPERPIRVGMGINAGETVQRGEGFVGSAVNLAARVCAQAREGELLVTAAVRDTLGASPDLHFVPRGTRRLKGISRPVTLFAVRPAGAAKRPQPALGGGRLLAVAAVLIGLVVLGGGAWALTAGIGRTASASAPPASASDRSTSSAGASQATASASSVASDVFPTAAETELLEVLGGGMVDRCERADEDDRPVILVDAATAQAFNLTPEDRVAALVGIECEIPSVTAPDTVHLWETRRIADYEAVDVPEAIILNRSGRLGLPRGDCADGGPAHQRWELGDLGGWLLCNEVFGDAVVEWSYDGHPLLGRAVRRDGDHEALLRWWTAEVRLASP